MKAKVCEECGWVPGPGVEVCPHCEGRLADANLSYEDLTVVYETSQLMDAKIVRGVLEGNGIAAYIPAEEWVALIGGISAVTGKGLRVMVPASMKDRALQAIEEAREEGRAMGDEEDIPEE